MKTLRNKEIKEICSELEKFWRKYPELRFWQLLCIVQHKLVPNSGEPTPDCFYVEDNKTLQEFKNVNKL